ncbi:hypothetical protein [uncultured Sulfitobacter sp.]|uniref:hypothetical protein n=1 Tax=uncultured Sulfitobacter sp. TaxID=191468 RepID=UPI00260DBC1D|nr:hypothetical protein [uncultured Sulfitobacter sp.]
MRSIIFTSVLSAAVWLSPANADVCFRENHSHTGYLDSGGSDQGAISCMVLEALSDEESIFRKYSFSVWIGRHLLVALSDAPTSQLYLIIRSNSDELAKEYVANARMFDASVAQLSTSLKNEVCRGEGTRSFLKAGGVSEYRFEASFGVGLNQIAVRDFAVFSLESCEGSGE